MHTIRTVSPKTRNNWILDAGLFITALVAILSGVYFLVFPDGGYKGGRNPYYGIRILFEREGWEWMHTWIGLAMIAAAVIHLALHWKWVISTTHRIVSGFLQRKSTGNRASWMNVLVDGVLGLGFIMSAISGVYFLLTPDSKGGTVADPMILFSRAAWDNLHTWSSVAFIIAAILHFVIHWGWVTKVTRKVFSRKRGLVIEPVALQTN